MQTTTYKCDRCGKEDANNEMNLKRISIQWGTHGAITVCYAEWCQACMTAIGALKPRTTEEKELQPDPINIEDLVREIVQEELG